MTISNPRLVFCLGLLSQQLFTGHVKERDLEGVHLHIYTNDMHSTLSIAECKTQENEVSDHIWGELQYVYILNISIA